MALPCQRRTPPGPPAHITSCESRWIARTSNPLKSDRRALPSQRANPREVPIHNTPLLSRYRQYAELPSSPLVFVIYVNRGPLVVFSRAPPRGEGFFSSIPAGS